MRKATLILDDDTRFCGYSFGAHKCIGGEVVFNTAMTGYTESLTDPSYAGQIMVLTYPLIGNYGVPASDLWESAGIFLPPNSSTTANTIRTISVVPRAINCNITFLSFSSLY